MTTIADLAQHAGPVALEAFMAVQSDRHVRSILPIPDIRKPGFTAFDVKDPDSKFPPIETVLPPKGAPNVLIILLDDVGLRRTPPRVGTSSCTASAPAHRS